MSENSVEPEIETDDAEVSEAPPPQKPTTGARASKPAAGPGLLSRIAQFVRDTRAEMRRVSWPTLIMVRNTTIITLIAVVFFSLYLFAVDRVWAFLIEHLRSWLGG